MAQGLIAREALTIARILKVNHAGEHGAIKIYKAQVWVSRLLWPELVPHLSSMLTHEIQHRLMFQEAMPPRQARPCRVMSLWGVGGAFLGFGTAVLGRQSIWTTTVAVEAAVHRHLDDQLGFLANRDRALHAMISAVREEELAHLHTAEAHIEGDTTFRRMLYHLITMATDTLIWLSTWGDSSRMSVELAAASSSTLPQPRR